MFSWVFQVFAEGEEGKGTSGRGSPVYRSLGGRWRCPADLGSGSGEAWMDWRGQHRWLWAE